jgi:transposase
MTKYTLHSDILSKFPSLVKACKARSRSGTLPDIHIGLDVDLKLVALCARVAGGTPKDLGKHTRPVIVELVRRLIKLGHRVVVAQESCGFGPYFHRELLAAGAHSLLIAPEALSGKRKTDKADARQLVNKLYQFEHDGDRKALRPIRDHHDGARRYRAISRQRAQMQKARQQLSGNGRGLMHDFGFHDVPEGWWGQRKWPKLRAKLIEHDAWIVDMLDPIHDAIARLHSRIRQLQGILLELAPPGQTPRPKGLGELCQAIINSEVVDWHRFSNRRQVSIFTGLCSGEHSSGTKRRQGAIDRQGNRRLRKQLVEAVWRLRNWNKGWRGFAKFPHVFGEGARVGPAARKKAVVACARMLMVDLWRLNTGQTTLENLGLLPA